MTPAQAALAWLLVNDDIIVIPKTGYRERLKENLSVLDYRLGAQRDEGERTLLIIFNSYHDAVSFTLPSNGGSTGWRHLLDTQDDADDAQESGHNSGEEIEIPGRSLRLLAASEEP